MQKELALGPDREEAAAVWRTHTLEQYLAGCGAIRILHLLEGFRLVEIPLRDLKLRPAIYRQLATLENFFTQFGNPELTSPWPDVEAYFEFRGTRAEIRAGACIRLCVHVWNWAQQHSIVEADLKCPWTSRVVTERNRKSVLLDLGEALLHVACDAGILTQSHPARDEQKTTGLLSGSDQLPRPTENVNSLESASPEARIYAVIAAVPAANDLEIEAFRRHAAKQLTCDGRADLARELRRLSANELQMVLNMALQAAGGTSPATLILGTRRALRLGAQRRILLAKKRKHQGLQ